MIRDRFCIGRLIHRRAGERGNKGVLPVTVHPCIIILSRKMCHRTYRRRRIKASRKCRAYGDIAPHPQLAGIKEKAPEHLNLFFIRRGKRNGIIKRIPPPVDLYPVFAGICVRSRRETFDTFNNALFGTFIKHRSAGIRNESTVWLNLIHKGSDHLHLRTERDPSVIKHHIVQRLNTEPVP